MVQKALFSMSFAASWHLPHEVVVLLCIMGGLFIRKPPTMFVCCNHAAVTSLVFFSCLYPIEGLTIEDLTDLAKILPIIIWPQQHI